jgi:CelD/BcsL family acetyltransferase involved in cellulose biosynthesis
MAVATAPVREFASLKVEADDRTTIMKLASLRDTTIANLFASDDVRRFFRGLLSAELARETKRISGTK